MLYRDKKIKNNLKKLRIDKGFTTLELSRITGISQTQITNLENYKRNLTEGSISKISKALNVRPSELIDGDYNLTINIPFINQVLSAGNGEPIEYQENGFLTIKKNNEFFKEWTHRIAVNGLKAFQVKGDSMEPTIKDGSYVFVDTNIITYDGEGVYALLLNNEFFIKRLSSLSNGEFDLISDNKIYNRRTISTAKDNLQILGKLKLTLETRKI